MGQKQKERRTRATLIRRDAAFMMNGLASEPGRKTHDLKITSPIHGSTKA